MNCWDSKIANGRFSTVGWGIITVISAVLLASLIALLNS